MAPSDLTTKPIVVTAWISAHFRSGGPRAEPETVWWRNVGASGVRGTGKQRKTTESRDYTDHKGPTYRPIRHDYLFLSV